MFCKHFFAKKPQSGGDGGAHAAMNAAAGLILGVSFQTAVFHHFWGNRTPERDLRAQMRKAIQAAVPGLAPRDGTATK
jgi:hypothetical protein